MSKDKNGKEIIQDIIDVCSHSIWTDELGLRESIGRSDTYMMRNTLKSMLEFGYINVEPQENKCLT